MPSLPAAGQTLATPPALRALRGSAGPTQDDSGSRLGQGLRVGGLNLPVPVFSSPSRPRQGLPTPPHPPHPYGAWSHPNP